MVSLKKFLPLLLLLFIITLGVELILRMFDPTVQIVRVAYKGNKIGEEGSFMLSDNPILLYEWKRLPQEINAKKQKSTHRIIVLGDSVVFRKEYPLEDCFPHILENFLNIEAGMLQYEVLNVGIPGYNTQQEAEYLEKRLLPFSPDMLIVAYCTSNDRVIKRSIKKYPDGLFCSDIREDYPYVSFLPDFVSHFLMRHSLVWRLLNYKVAYFFEKKYGGFWKKKIKYSNLSSETENAVKKIRDIALKEKFDLLFVIFPSLQDGLESECDWIIDKCRQYAISYIDLRGVFKEIGYGKIRASERDYCHPNKLGNHAVAKEIYRYFKNNTIRR